MSVIVLIVDEYCVLASETERDSPVAADRDGPATLELSFQRMQSQVRKTP